MRWRASIGTACAIALALSWACFSCGAEPRAPGSGSSSDPQSLYIPPIGTPADAAPPEPAAVVIEDDRVPRPTNLAIPERDPRFHQRRARSRALLLTEVQGLERLLDTTKGPDRPAILRRVAETYSEMAYTSSGPEAVRARESAIRHYGTLRVDHPTYAEMGDVLYFLGLSYELNGDPTNARKAYYEVIAKSPKSKYVPFCYFAFGEMFYEEAVQDPMKNDLAIQAFMEVLRFPSPANPLHPDALLRLGELALRQQNKAKATEHFNKLRRDFPSSGAAQKIP